MGLKLKKKSPISEKEILSKRGKKSRRKGANYEREISKILEEYLDVEFVRTPQSGGFCKKSDKAEDFRGDIIPVDSRVKLNLHIECKNQQKWNCRAWLEQAQQDCPSSKIPIIIMKKGNTSKKVGVVGNQQNLVMVDLEHFLDLVDLDKLIQRGG